MLGPVPDMYLSNQTLLPAGAYFDKLGAHYRRRMHTSFLTGKLSRLSLVTNDSRALPVKS
jgi:hypothetical protein